MKKLATFVFALLLAGSLSFAQATGTTAAPAPAPDAKKAADTSDTKKAHKGKKHKGGKKKKGAETTAAPAAPK